MKDIVTFVVSIKEKCLPLQTQKMNRRIGY